MIKTIDGALWQWNTGRLVQIVPRPGTTVDKVTCYNGTTENAVQLVLQNDGEKVTAEIPNIFLQSANNITVYSTMLDATGERTTESAMFGVNRQPKPDDYVYTETELQSWKAMAESYKATSDNFESVVMDYKTLSEDYKKLSEEYEQLSGDYKDTANEASAAAASVERYEALSTQYQTTAETVCKTLEDVGALVDEINGEVI